jgi:hypothetical protein
MKNALIIIACLACISLGISDTKNEQYTVLVRDFPTAKVLVQQGKELDALERQLSALEVEMDSVK